MHCCSVEIVPVSKDSVVCLPHKLTQQLGAISPLCLVHRVTSSVHLIDPATTQSKSYNIANVSET
jgi:nonsense-mediated mRNA decay protein 3